MVNRAMRNDVIKSFDAYFANNGGGKLLRVLALPNDSSIPITMF